MKKVFILFVVMILGFTTYAMAAEKNYDGPVGPSDIEALGDNGKCALLKAYVYGENIALFIKCIPDNKSNYSEVSAMYLVQSEGKPFIYMYSYKDNVGVVHVKVLNPVSKYYKEIGPSGVVPTE